MRPGGVTHGDLKNRACERELDAQVGVPVPGLEGLSSENPRQLGLEGVSYTASSEGPARREDASAQEQESGLEGTLSESLENQLPHHEQPDLYC